MATPTIRYNSKGRKVADLQKRLLALGFNPGPVEGIVHHAEHGVLYTSKATAPKPFMASTPSFPGWKNCSAMDTSRKSGRMDEVVRRSGE